MIFEANKKHTWNLGVNIVEIVDEKVGMYEADCPDKVCYSPEYISRPGETIVCLPNRIVIEVKGEEPQEDDEDIITGFKSDNHD
ncbi:NusG domain II-containing protein [Proteiniclasticum ruminis]|uniref:NusG domain II n=1 Tax=Proteiniclasticum ruminis TaxID=398199 RepID=A0A1G8GVX2_9CLOT|nr:NusG domain II-containing protein [Proteiniclasticum ruminis]SDH98509.1 NusG domain II [Proteiniclasticum ruminis]